MCGALPPYPLHAFMIWRLDPVVSLTVLGTGPAQLGE
jgi:hypothetical protein